MKKILIAEDEKPMAKALELKLSHAGFEVSLAFNGEEALKLAKETPYDLLLLDLMMPKIDGFTVLKEIQQSQSKLPVIVLSNLSQADDEQKARALGARDFFVKSNTPLAEIVNHVNSVLGL